MKFTTKQMNEAKEEGWPDSEDWGNADERTGLFETDDEDKPIRLIGVDCGEPEDRLFCRDWDWVPYELNKLADRIRELEKEKP